MPRQTVPRQTSLADSAVVIAFAHGFVGKSDSELIRPRFFLIPPTAGSFGVSAQIGSGVVRGVPEVRFQRVPPGFDAPLMTSWVSCFCF